MCKACPQGRCSNLLYDRKSGKKQHQASENELVTSGVEPRETVHAHQPLLDIFIFIISLCFQNGSGRWGPALLLPHVRGCCQHSLKVTQLVGGSRLALLFTVADSRCISSQRKAL